MANLFGRSIGGSGGRSAFGSVPGPIDIPPNIFAQASGIVPNLGALATGAGAVAGNELAGRLSPETLRNIQDEGAAWGVSSGMPGFTPGSLVQNRSLRNLGLNTEAMQRQGVQDFLSTLTGIGSTLTPQPLAADIANRNSIMAAAPDPQMAAQEQLRQWMQKFMLTQGTGGRSLNWAQMNSGGTPNISGFGTGTPQFIGNPSLGGPGAVAAGATGPFSDYRSPAGGTGQYSITGNTIGGSAHDDVLDAFFNPEDYFWNPPSQTASASSSTMGPI